VARGTGDLTGKDGELHAEAGTAALLKRRAQAKVTAVVV